MQSLTNNYITYDLNVERKERGLKQYFSGNSHPPTKSERDELRGLGCYPSSRHIDGNRDLT
jgi:hypothetical protein